MTLISSMERSDRLRLPPYDGFVMRRRAIGRSLRGVADVVGAVGACDDLGGASLFGPVRTREPSGYPEAFHKGGLRKFASPWFKVSAYG